MNLILYHGNCPDGFCAAFIAKKRYPNAELAPCTYGVPPPDVTDRDVLVVDFSWPRMETLVLATKAKTMRIFDHHKTAEKELEGLAFATFDMNRSGAALTWDKLFPGEPRPWYVDYVQDRDLWRWELPDSKEVSGYVMALPHTIEAWSTLDQTSAREAAAAGKAIRLHIDHYISKVTAQAQRREMNGHRVAVVNAAYPNISDVCSELLSGPFDIGLGWFERGDGRMQFSLRSRGELDVSAIAKSFGGGGHKNAAGFELSLGDGRHFLDTLGYES